MGTTCHCSPTWTHRNQPYLLLWGAWQGPRAWGGKLHVHSLHKHKAFANKKNKPRCVYHGYDTQPAPSAGGIWHLIFQQHTHCSAGSSSCSCAAPLGAEGPQGRDCSITKRFTPLITVHSPRVCYRGCSETAAMKMAQLNLTSASPGFNQCLSVTHSPLNLSAPAQFRPGSMQVSLV